MPGTARGCEIRAGSDEARPKLSLRLIPRPSGRHGERWGWPLKPGAWCGVTAIRLVTMTTDEYLQSQIMPMLSPGEQVLHSAYMRRQPGLVMQMLFVGGLLLFLITKAYFVVLTNRRMILIRTKMGFWTGGPAQLRLGVEQWDIRNIARCTTSGFANNRSMTFVLHQGGSQTLRISPWGKKVQGTRQFLEQVPSLLNSGQLQQLAAGAPALPLLGAGQPQMPQSQMAPQQPQMQQMQQPQMHVPQPQIQPGGFPPGTRVVVQVQDGSRHPATIVQLQHGQYLCAMPNGQSYWFPMQHVTPA